MGVEDAVDADGAGGHEPWFAVAAVRVLGVKVDGDIKGVADVGACVGVVDHGEGVEVGVVGVAADGGDAVGDAGGFDVGEFDPFGAVGDGFEVEGVAGEKSKWRMGWEGGMLGAGLGTHRVVVPTAFSMGLEHRFALVARRRCRRIELVLAMMTWLLFVPWSFDHSQCLLNM